MTEPMYQSRIALPSWLISLLLHLALVLVLGLTLGRAAPRGDASERTAEVGIVLKHQDGEETYFESPEKTGTADSAASAASSTSVEELLSDPLAGDPTSVLPSSFQVIGPGMPDGSGVPTVGTGDGPRGGGDGIGGKARTGVFGIVDEGQKFAYVFDRSESMNTRNALDEAKNELIGSLQNLDKTHQFQIIFYNDSPKRFNPTAHPTKLFFATERNKDLAAKFVRGIQAFSSTDHERALRMAINTGPDVIFFLTDGLDPGLSPRQLADVHRRANGITIHCIEFGFGSQEDSNNFLVQLAHQNGGKHVYVDITGLSPRRR